MIALNDAMQADFDRATLDTATDANLYSLLKKIDSAIQGWEQQEQPLEPHEQMWYRELNKLAYAIRTTLNTRYGCND